MTKVFNGLEHDFFDELITILLSSCSFGIATHAFIIKSGLIVEDGDGSNFAGKTILTKMRFAHKDLLGPISQNKWPESLELEIVPHDSAFPDHVKLKIETHGEKGATGIVMQGAFIRYYERRRADVESRFGAIRVWPDVWKFAWVVRNAFAHGGKIVWTRDVLIEVQWKGIVYKRSTDIGKQILYKDISIIEVIYLMEEMDAELK
jgi:hypothetical protein